MSNPTPEPRPPSLRPTTPLVGVFACLLGVLVAALTLVFWIMMFRATPGRGTVPAQVLVGGAILVVVHLGSCLLGIVLGVIALTRPRSRKRWPIVGLVVIVFSFGGLSLALGQLVSNLGPTPSRTVGGRASRRAHSDDAATRPIPVSASAKTSGDFRKIAHARNVRTMVESYERLGSRNEAWDEPAREMIRSWVLFFDGDPSAPEIASLDPLSRKLLALGCDDPLVLYCCARTNQEAPFIRDLFERSVAGYKERKYPRYLAMFSALRVGRAYSDLKLGDDMVRQADDQALAFLGEAIEDGSYTAQEMPILVEELDGQPLFERRGADVCALFEKNPSVEKWITHTLRGLHYKNAAWEARGGGYASTVTAAGWKGFRDNLEKATQEFTESWKLKPDHPLAATAMIAVAMGSGGEPRASMRMWFERAIAAKLDHRDAYNAMVWGLRPRWFGSHEDMLAFGKRCLETKRFDTWVPDVYFGAVLDIASELQDPDAIYRWPGVYENLSEMFQGYAQDPTRAAEKGHFESHLALLNHKCGRFAEARRHLDAAGSKISTHAAATWHEDPTLVAQRIFSAASPASSDLDAAEECDKAQDLAGALRHYKAAEQKAAGDPPSLAFVRQKLAMLTLEQQWTTGDWIPFLPSPGLDGWHVERGHWKVLEDGALEVETEVDGMLITSLARLGSNFELKGEIELVSSSNGEFQAGVVFGYPGMKDSRWMSFRVKRNSKEGETAYFSRHFYAPDTPVKVPVSEKNQVLIQSWRGKVTAYLNGKVLVESLTPPEGALPQKPDCRVGFGGFYDQNQCVVRFRNVMIRKLNGPPAPP